MHSFLSRFFSGITLALLSGSLAYGQGDLRDNGWSHFDVGSWVTMQETWKSGAKSGSQRQKFVIQGITNDHVAVAEGPEEPPKDGKKLVSHRLFRKMPHELGVASDKTRKESLQIAGKKFDCTVDRFTKKLSDPDITFTYVVWRTKGVKIPYREIPRTGDVAMPPDAVKVELRIDAKGTVTKYAAIVEDFERKIKVGKHELTCVVEKWTVEELETGKGKMTGEIRVWLSDAVPGCEVKVQAKGNWMDTPEEFELVVVDFVALKKKQ